MRIDSDFYTRTAEESLKDLRSGHGGLNDEEAARRLDAIGPNEIPEKKAESPIVLFLRQFNSVLIYVLLAAAGISFYFDHMIDVYVILGIVIINATMGFIQEYRAEKSIMALKRMVVPFARVFRNGELTQIKAAQLVPGDVISLEEGDRVPADARLIEAKNIRAVEASLTGESFPSDKDISPLARNVALADIRNMVWLGTFIASGRSKAVVTATGEKTILGQVARDIRGMVQTRGHFERNTDKLAMQMGLVAIVFAAVIFSVGFLFRGLGIKDILLFSIASLVSGIPEGLPAVLVIVLAIGAHNMARRKAIIRKLSAIDTIGAVTAIVTDKTGTLTLNMMTVKRILLPGEGEISVGGDGWEPTGGFHQNGTEIAPLERPGLNALLHVAAVCNSAKLVRENEGHTIIGDPTEGAMLVLAEKAGLHRQAALAKDKPIDEMPFTSDLKLRATLVETGGRMRIYVAGAAEILLSRSSRAMRGGREVALDKKAREEALDGIETLAKGGMRTIALCFKEAPKGTSSFSEKSLDGLIFLGMVGMADPPRPEVRDAIAKAKKAGIRVIMATGDHKTTAVAIARDIGIIGDGEDAEAITGEEILTLSDEDFMRAAGRCRVFARLTPHAKLRLAEALQKRGHIVAMTGDGVNDAPALKKADVGISMGLSGTDVARESSDIILADDNFASIVNGVEEGRVVFRNVRQTSYFLITTNFAEGTAIISTLLMGLPLPLLPTQILWLNLVTAGVSDVALATEHGHGEVLDETPRKRDGGVISREHLPFILMITAIIVLCTLGAYLYFINESVEKARTGAFLAIAFGELYNLLNMRSLRKSLFEIGPISNRYIAVSLVASIALIAAAVHLEFFQVFFHFVSIETNEFLGIAAVTSSVFWAGEAYKFAKSRRVEGGKAPKSAS